MEKKRYEVNSPFRLDDADYTLFVAHVIFSNILFSLTLIITPDI